MSQAVLDQDSVLAHEGDDIAHRADSGQVGVVLQQTLHIGVLALDGLDQLECHAHAGQFLEGAGAVLSVRIDHSDCVRQDFGNGMVVGDHGIHAQFGRVCDLVYSGHAVVHGDYQLDSALIQKRDSLAVHTVALALSRGDVIHDVGSDIGEVRIQQSGGGDAVCVEISVDADALAALDSLTDSSDRPVHVLDLKGRGGQGLGRQEFDDLALPCDPADIEQHGDDHRQLIALRNGRRVFFIQLSGDPFLHSSR